jgi:hypothetical protein
VLLLAVALRAGSGAPGWRPGRRWPALRSRIEVP